MRWFWVDRFTEFVSGKCATAIKAVSLAEEQLHDHLPGYPVMPNSLVVEGMALTGGLLVSEYNNFEERVILAKISRSLFHCHVVPGEMLTFRAVIQQIRKDGAMVTTTSHVGDALQAEAEIFFAHLDGDGGSQELFDRLEFLIWLRLWRVFEVGRKADGSRLEVPPKLAAAALKSDREENDVSDEILAERGRGEGGMR